MEDLDSKNHADRNAENPNGSENVRPSAIERQKAAVSRLGYGSEFHGRTAEPSRRFSRDSSMSRRKFRRFGLMHPAVLLLMIVAGIGLVFFAVGRPPQMEVGANVQSTGQVVRNENSLPVTDTESMESEARSPSPTSSEQPANDLQASAATDDVKVTDSQAISIPAADISLRSRPELLEQLVQVYRAKLVDDPNNAAAQTGLNQLQERSLSELQTIVLEEGDASAVKALEVVARLFPEAADSARYRYLVARADRDRQKKEDAPAEPEQMDAPKPTASSVIDSSKTAASTSDTVPAVSSRKNDLSETSSSPMSAAKTSGSAQSTKPEISSVSITPGTLVNNQFSPSDGGNVFMVEIGYRNFGRAFVGEAEATLVTLLGAPDDPLVLAETPVVITADRGTKNFLIETNAVQGYAGGKFRLNFILNDEFLTSRTVRVSMPRRH
jgi:hypothetical protein